MLHIGSLVDFYISIVDHYKGVAFTGSYHVALSLDWYISHYPINNVYEENNFSRF